MTTTLNTRIDAKTKEEVRKILDCLGLTMSEAIEMFFRQVVHYQGIPFEIRLPNKDTMQAVRELKSGKGKKYKSVKAMKKGLKR